MNKDVYIYKGFTNSSSTNSARIFGEIAQLFSAGGLVRIAFRSGGVSAAA